MLVIDDARRADIRRHVGHRRNYDQVSGIDGLVASVVMRAHLDALGPDEELRADAVAYLTGPVFREHRRLLGIAPGSLPAGLRYAEEQ